MKMPKLLLSLFIFFMAAGHVTGQMIKKTVALAPIYYSPSTCSRDDAERLYNYVLNTMQNTQRIEVLDRFFGQGLISVEKKLNQGVDFVEGKIVDQGKQKGAQFILFVYVNSVQAYELQQEKTDKDTKAKSLERVGYDCDLSLFARVINVETGQVVASQIITPSGLLSLGEISYASEVSNKIVRGVLSNVSRKPQSPQEAITKKMEDLEPYVRRFIDEVFPIEVLISKIKEVPKNLKKPDGDKEKELLIIGGKSTGFKEGDILVVKEIVMEEIDGKIYPDEIPIGKIKVTRANLDLVGCKFTEGESIVMDRFNKNPKSLKVVFIPGQKGLFK